MILSIRTSLSVHPIGAVALASVALVFAACSSGEEAGSAAGTTEAQGGQERQIRVVTTLYPLEYFARRVGGDLVKVTNLVGPGVSGHDFEPSPEDMRTMQAADLIVVNGVGFEPWIDRAIASLGDGVQPVVKVSHQFSLNDAGASAGGADPHLWLDPLKAKHQVEAVLEALATADTIHQEVYEQHAGQLLVEIELLHDQYSSTLQTCRHSIFVTSHAAFGHLASRYGLTQIALAGISSDAEPATGELARLTRQIDASGVKYVLAETFGGRRLSQTVANEIGATVLDMHPLESLTPDQADSGETYLSIMRSNLESLSTALECE